MDFIVTAHVELDKPVATDSSNGNAIAFYTVFGVAAGSAPQAAIVAEEEIKKEGSEDSDYLGTVTSVEVSTQPREEWEDVEVQRSVTLVFYRSGRVFYCKEENSKRWWEFWKPKITEMKKHNDYHLVDTIGTSCAGPDRITSTLAGNSMFTDIPKEIVTRMRELEAVDAQDRKDGTTRLERLRQIPPETGKFVALLAASAPAGQYIEIGTSAGYSTLWLALACRLIDRKITTFEILDEKAVLARQTFKTTDVGDVVDFVHGDALDYLPTCTDVSFCFLDAEKEIYAECYEAVVPNMVSGGFLVADNAINHETTLRPMLNRAFSDKRVDALVVPIGKGELVCRKI